MVELSPGELADAKAKFRKKAKEDGPKAVAKGLAKASFKVLIHDLLTEVGDEPPTDKDLDAAFVLADEDKGGTVDENEFLKLFGLVKSGAVAGLGKRSFLPFGSRSKRKQQASFKASFKEPPKPPATANQQSELGGTPLSSASPPAGGGGNNGKTQIKPKNGLGDAMTAAAPSSPSSSTTSSSSTSPTKKLTAKEEKAAAEVALKARERREALVAAKALSRSKAVSAVAVTARATVEEAAAAASAAIPLAVKDVCKLETILHGFWADSGGSVEGAGGWKRGQGWWPSSPSSLPSSSPSSPSPSPSSSPQLKEWQGLKTVAVPSKTLAPPSSTSTPPPAVSFSSLSSSSSSSSLTVGSEIDGDLDGKGRGGAVVTEINLHFNGLRGTLSPLVGNLANLTVLALSCNKLSGPVPFTLGRLCQLAELRLQGNQFTGAIPTTFGGLRSLRVLDLSLNFLDFDVVGGSAVAGHRPPPRPHQQTLIKNKTTPSSSSPTSLSSSGSIETPTSPSTLSSTLGAFAPPPRPGSPGPLFLKALQALATLPDLTHVNLSGNQLVPATHANHSFDHCRTAPRAVLAPRPGSKAAARAGRAGETSGSLLVCSTRSQVVILFDGLLLGTTGEIDDAST